MDHVHFGHDVLVDDNVTIAPNVVLGGHTVVLEGATIGIGSSTHQFSTIGAFSMIGMNSTITRDVLRFLVSGSPGSFIGGYCQPTVTNLANHQQTDYNHLWTNSEIFKNM